MPWHRRSQPQSRGGNPNANANPHHSATFGAGYFAGQHNYRQQAPGGSDNANGGWWRPPWYILGLDNPGASKPEIDKNFRRLSLLLHPDQHMNEGQDKIEFYTYEFALLNQAKAKLVERKHDWHRVQVKAGWKRPDVVENWLRTNRGKNAPGESSGMGAGGNGSASASASGTMNPNAAGAQFFGGASGKQSAKGGGKGGNGGQGKFAGGGFYGGNANTGGAFFAGVDPMFGYSAGVQREHGNVGMHSRNIHENYHATAAAAQGFIFPGGGGSATATGSGVGGTKKASKNTANAHAAKAKAKAAAQAQQAEENNAASAKPYAPLKVNRTKNSKQPSPSASNGDQSTLRSFLSRAGVAGYAAAYNPGGDSKKQSSNGTIDAKAKAGAATGAYSGSSTMTSNARKSTTAGGGNLDHGSNKHKKSSLYPSPTAGASSSSSAPSFHQPKAAEKDASSAFQPEPRVRFPSVKTPKFTGKPASSTGQGSRRGTQNSPGSMRKNVGRENPFLRKSVIVLDDDDEDMGGESSKSKRKKTGSSSSGPRVIDLSTEMHGAEDDTNDDVIFVGATSGFSSSAGTASGNIASASSSSGAASTKSKRVLKQHFSAPTASSERSLFGLPAASQPASKTGSKASNLVNSLLESYAFKTFLNVPSKMFGFGGTPRIAGDASNSQPPPDRCSGGSKTSKAPDVATDRQQPAKLSNLRRMGSSIDGDMEEEGTRAFPPSAAARATSRATRAAGAGARSGDGDGDGDRLPSVPEERADIDNARLHSLNSQGSGIVDEVDEDVILLEDDPPQEPERAAAASSGEANRKEPTNFAGVAARFGGAGAGERGNGAAVPSGSRSVPYPSTSSATAAASGSSAGHLRTNRPLPAHRVNYNLPTNHPRAGGTASVPFNSSTASAASAASSRAAMTESRKRPRVDREQEVDEEEPAERPKSRSTTFSAAHLLTSDLLASSPGSTFLVREVKRLDAAGDKTLDELVADAEAATDQGNKRDVEKASAAASDNEPPDKKSGAPTDLTGAGSTSASSSSSSSVPVVAVVGGKAVSPVPGRVGPAAMSAGGQRQDERATSTTPVGSAKSDGKNAVAPGSSVPQPQETPEGSAEAKRDALPEDPPRSARQSCEQPRNGENKPRNSTVLADTLSEPREQQQRLMRKRRASTVEGAPVIADVRSGDKGEASTRGGESIGKRDDIGKSDEELLVQKNGTSGGGRKVVDSAGANSGGKGDDMGRSDGVPPSYSQTMRTLADNVESGSTRELQGRLSGGVAGGSSSSSTANQPPPPQLPSEHGAAQLHPGPKRRRTQNMEGGGVNLGGIIRNAPMAAMNPNLHLPFPSSSNVAGGRGRNRRDDVLKKDTPLRPNKMASVVGGHSVQPEPRGAESDSDPNVSINFDLDSRDRDRNQQRLRRSPGGLRADGVVLAPPGGPNQPNLRSKENSSKEHNSSVLSSSSSFNLHVNASFAQLDASFDSNRVAGKRGAAAAAPTTSGAATSGGVPNAPTKATGAPNPNSVAANIIRPSTIGNSADRPVERNLFGTRPSVVPPNRGGGTAAPDTATGDDDVEMRDAGEAQPPPASGIRTGSAPNLFGVRGHQDHRRMSEHVAGGGQLPLPQPPQSVRASEVNGSRLSNRMSIESISLGGGAVSSPPPRATVNSHGGFIVPVGRAGGSSLVPPEGVGTIRGSSSNSTNTNANAKANTIAGAVETGTGSSAFSSNRDLMNSLHEIQRDSAEDDKIDHLLADRFLSMGAAAGQRRQTPSKLPTVLHLETIRDVFGFRREVKDSHVQQVKDLIVELRRRKNRETTVYELFKHSLKVNLDSDVESLFRSRTDLFSFFFAGPRERCRLLA